MNNHINNVKRRAAIAAALNGENPTKEQRRALCDQFGITRQTLANDIWNIRNPRGCVKYRITHQIGSENARSVKHGNKGYVSADQWQEILDAHDNRCAKCGYSGDLDIDHIIPISKGGMHTPENIQPLCRLCNMAKSDRLD